KVTAANDLQLRSGSGGKVALLGGSVSIPSGAPLSSTVDGASNVTPTASFADGAHCGSGGSILSSSTTVRWQVTMGSSSPTTACPIAFGTAAQCANGATCWANDITQGFTPTQSSVTATGLTLGLPTWTGHPTDMHGDVVVGGCTCF